MKLKPTPFLAALAIAPVSAFAQNPSVVVTIENVSPYSGNFLTPVWVGMHDGSFDSYNGGEPASNLPIQGSDSLERLAEDGNTGPLSDDFAIVDPNGVQGTIASNGPIPPLAPGQTVSRLFEVDPSNNRYFSYVSMLIPSNDAFIANGSATAHPLFDESGNFVGTPFIVAGDEANDAGTEVNDEAPANTAFFGQAAPNTGVDEGANIVAHPGHNAAGTGGILDAPMFLNADFLQANQDLLRFSFTYLDKAAPLILDANLSPTFEVPQPQVSGNPSGNAFLFSSNGGETITCFAVTNGLSGNATAAHLHLGPVTQTGGVVAPLLVFGGRFIFAEIDASDVAGPLAGTADPIDALLSELIAGNVYLNVHTAANPAGEIRGQVYVNQNFLN